MSKNQTYQVIDNLLPPKLVGIHLGGVHKPISEQTLALWRKRGIGPVFLRIGKSIRYRKEDLDAFIKASINS